MIHAHRRKAGFALMLVMLLMAMAVVLGLSYLAAASLKVSSSDNYVTAAKARYLAESGMEHAMWLLQSDPSQLPVLTGAPLGPFYVDDTDGRYTFYGQPTGVPGQYRVIARGTHGAVTQETEALILRSPAPVYPVKKGLLMSTALAWLPSSLTVSGDVHVNGSLVNASAITGKGSATGVIADPYNRVLGGIRPYAPAEAPPDLEWNHYRTYFLFDTLYNSAQTFAQTFAGNSPFANGAAVTPANPGGVVEFKYVSRKVVLSNNLNFTGTVIIDGDVVLDGTNITLTAVPGFPAIACRKLVINANSRATIQGTVLALDGVYGGSLAGSGSQTKIEGSVIGNRGYDVSLYGLHRLNFKATRGELYNVKGNNLGQYQVRMGSYVR